ncbi:MAG: nitrous oxide reductase accessory protein NosL [Deltaproteobacteria bacterium]|nr:nitrous oxide reductase accessory protein NosL [Deltaproteobacteria bacterium]
MRRWEAGPLCYLLGLLVAGCQVSRADQPPQIRYGEEPCAFCGMLISEERFAAALTTSTGETKTFDDIGCLLHDLTKWDQSTLHVWVHDYGSGRWLKAQRAVFVRSREVPTPMGGGLFAFSAQEAAAQFANEVHGAVVRFDQLSSAIDDHASFGLSHDAVHHSN